jgi:Arc/MetJ-type ribon-helix-helix transcriptional regulator
MSERPTELEMVAIPVPVTIRLKDALEAYADSHKADGKAPSNADLMRKAIASVIRYDLAKESTERAKYSKRQRYATDEERIDARKRSQATHAQEVKDALEWHRAMQKQAAIDALTRTTK